MMASFLSTASSFRLNDPKNNDGMGDALGGTRDAGAETDEEEEDLQNPEVETTVTLVGNVKDRPVFIVDDMIDKAGSWIAAAETVVKRGGATKVYCIATHGLFGGDCLREMQECECIEQIIVTNSFPLGEQGKEGFWNGKHGSSGKNKLVVLDVSALLGEAIRRNHNGESISQLFMHYD
jgi:ribose-phosphate pyrophosphokinase